MELPLGHKVVNLSDCSDEGLVLGCDAEMKEYRRKLDGVVPLFQTLPDATPPIDKIHPFSKIAITFTQSCDYDIL